MVINYKAFHKISHLNSKYLFFNYIFIFIISMGSYNAEFLRIRINCFLNNMIMKNPLFYIYYYELKYCQVSGLDVLYYFLLNPKKHVIY